MGASEIRHLPGAPNSAGGGIVPPPAASSGDGGVPGTPLLELSHAAIWRDHGYLVTAGLDRLGRARTVRVSAVGTGAGGDRIQALERAALLVGGYLRAGWRAAALADTFRTGAPAFLAGHLAEIERQAGPIVRFAHGLEAKP